MYRVCIQPITEKTESNPKDGEIIVNTETYDISVKNNDKIVSAIKDIRSNIDIIKDFINKNKYLFESIFKDVGEYNGTGSEEEFPDGCLLDKFYKEIDEITSITGNCINYKEKIEDIEKKSNEVLNNINSNNMDILSIFVHLRLIISFFDIYIVRSGGAYSYKLYEVLNRYKRYFEENEYILLLIKELFEIFREKEFTNREDENKSDIISVENNLISKVINIDKEKTVTNKDLYFFYNGKKISYKCIKVNDKGNEDFKINEMLIDLINEINKYPSQDELKKVLSSKLITDTKNLKKKYDFISNISFKLI